MGKNLKGDILTPVFVVVLFSVALQWASSKFISIKKNIKIKNGADRQKATEEGLTDEGNSRGETGPDVSSQTVLHSEPEVQQLLFIEVGTWGGDIEDSCDACCGKGLSAGWVDSTAQKQEGQQLHRTSLLK